jgi:hypothetical protein
MTACFNKEDEFVMTQSWLVAHNAWNTNQNPGNNQSYTITELLDYGVRGLALDIYGDTKDKLHLQHGHDNPATAIKWSIIRDEIKNWMKKPANAREIVTLFFESYLDSDTAYQGLEDSLYEINSEIQVYKKGKTVQETALKGSKVSQLIASNHRLFAFIQDPSVHQHDKFPVMSETIEENMYGDASIKTSKWLNYRRSTRPPRLMAFFMNHMADSPALNWNSNMKEHALDFLCAYGVLPAFITVDNIECKAGNQMAQDMQELAKLNSPHLRTDKFIFTKSSPSDTQFGNDYDKVRWLLYTSGELWDNLKVSYQGGQGVTDIGVRELVKGQDKEMVGAEIVNKGGYGIVNIRFKRKGENWIENWETPYEKSGESGTGKRSFEPQVLSAGAKIRGFIMRKQQGYGVTDFVLVYVV